MIDITDDFVEWLHEQSKERLEVAEARAEKRELEFWDDDSYMDILTDELKIMYLDDLLSDMMDRGLVEGHAKADGSVGFTLPGDTLPEEAAA